MPPTKEELKAQLMAEAEEVIDELVGQANEKEDITLGDIERLDLPLISRTQKMS